MSTLIGAPILLLYSGCTMAYPTTDLPPHIFGTCASKRSCLLVNMDNNSTVPATATILMTYLTQTSTEKTPIPTGVETIRFNCSPYE
jgi:hypothetical protein